MNNLTSEEIISEAGSSWQGWSRKNNASKVTNFCRLSPKMHDDYRLIRDL